MNKINSLFQKLLNAIAKKIDIHKQNHFIWNAKNLLVSFTFLFFFIWLYGLLKSTYNKTIVDVIFSKAPDINLGFFLSALYLTIASLITWHIVKKYQPGKFQPTSIFITLMLAVSTSYWKERIRGTYSYTSLFNVQWIAMTDPIFLYITLLGIWYLYLALRSKDIKSYIPAITRDDAVKIIALDAYQRSDFVLGIARQIKSIKFKDGNSVVMGLTGEWGTGKTSTMKLIAEDLKNDKDYDHISIEFNPWIANNSANMIQDFFDILESKVSKYIATSNVFRKYGKDLTQIDDDKNPFKAFSSLLEDKSLQDKFAKLTTLIGKVDRPLIVFIDDLDRLNKNEVFDMLKLIRSSACFPNMLFLVAYDKGFIEDCLILLDIPNSQRYLEKIINLEVQLPFISQGIISGLLVNELIEQAKRRNIQPLVYATEVEKMIRDLVFGSSVLPSIDKYNILSTLSKIFINKRDIIRFANTFSLKLGFLYEKLYVPDLFILELIRFIEQDLYNLLGSTKSYLVDGFLNPTNVEIYYLYSVTNPGIALVPPPDQFNLVERIQQRFSNHRDILTTLVNALFAPPSKKDTNAEFALLHREHFDNYFTLTLPSGNITTSFVQSIISNP
jgi:predicted AAA+ superfamily ATPase